MRKEVGGSPSDQPRSYASRSPLRHAESIAGSCVPLQLWWSVEDRVIRDQDEAQSGKLFSRIQDLNPDAPVSAYVGFWAHSREMRASSVLPLALADLGLLDSDVPSATPMNIVPSPQTADLCRPERFAR
jgi:hypothetical protein